VAVAMHCNLSRQTSPQSLWALNIYDAYNAPAYQFNNTTTFANPYRTHVPNFSKISRRRAA